jgi:putative SOS response-associated peptidase YedK
MCGRFTLQTPNESLSSLFDALRFPKLHPRYNIAPTQDILSVRQSLEGDNEAVMLRWGLVPSWAKDLKIGARMINARSETAATKPSFRAAFQSRRCVIVADGFYEWKKVAKEKQPYYITRVDKRPFCLAGLWESWVNQEAGDDAPSAIETCAILTTEANEMMDSIHHRMPVFLAKEQRQMWLDVTFQDREKLEQVLKPCPNDWLQATAVSKFVNKAANDHPECIEPAKAQGDLGF